MGVCKPFSSGTASLPATAPRRTGDPNPHRFEVLSCTEHDGVFLSVIRYPDCTNFEGKKVIVSRVDPRTALVFDPHFTKGGDIVARFEPTEEGIELAGWFVLAMRRPVSKL